MTESGGKKGRLKVLYDLSDVKNIIYTEPVFVFFEVNNQKKIQKKT